MPILVAIIGGLTFVAGLILFIVGVLSFVAASLVIDLTTGTLSGGLILVAAVIFLLFGWGLLKGWRIMWYLGIILYVLVIIGSIFELPAGFVSLVIGIIVVWYLTRPKVKMFFLGSA